MNIQEMLKAIHESGLNDYRIAERTGIAQSHIFRARKGQLKTVSYERGKKIEALYKQIKTGEQPCQPPQTRNGTPRA